VTGVVLSQVSHAIYSGLEREGQQSAVSQLSGAGAGRAASAQQLALGAALPHVTKVNAVTQEMIGHYVAIEEYYMLRNVSLV